MVQGIFLLKTRGNEMKSYKKITNLVSKGALILSLGLLSCHCFANDLLATALEGDVKDSLGSNGLFWKIFILVDIILATAMAVKSKNPMVFLGVAGITFIPAFLIKAFVF